MIDESVVKRLAVQSGAQILGGAFMLDFEELVAFANAIAAHQREIDAEICDNLRSTYYCVDVREAAEAIRKQGEVK